MSESPPTCPELAEGACPELAEGDRQYIYTWKIPPKPIRL